LVILGTYNGKPPSLGKGGFPFSSISCARCHAPPLGNQRQENEALALGPSAMSGLFATTPGPRCCGPVQLCDSLRLPGNAGRAGAGAMRCWDFLCEWLDMLAMGPNAMLRLLVNPKALALRPDSNNNNSKSTASHRGTRCAGNVKRP
jgi:hypothetical protein